MEMVGACMQKATGIPNKASPTMDPSGTSRRRPTETWRRTVERGLRNGSLTAEDRPRWKALQLHQAPDRSERTEWRLAVSVYIQTSQLWTRPIDPRAKLCIEFREMRKYFSASFPDGTFKQRGTIPED
ncbi:hypothetical protein ElyMa_005139900 [Elysia marginata]|uniref:Uncharacterized protein n=1 Tax=Elysia marginata TaxID=1093978 RepID=A0AAV4JP73_9GAST|nr:hypothetical protein ElyMa_005139900 [Elysia marginata]